LEQLQEIDPAADLIYWKDGEWILGVWLPPNRLREGAATRSIARAKYELPEGPAAAAQIQRMELARRGFRAIGTYENVPFGRIIRDFRVTQWNYLHNMQATLAKAFADMDTDRYLDQRVASLRDYVHSEARHVWRHTHRHPKSVVVK
jgi:hypothetical protein